MADSALMLMHAVAFHLVTIPSYSIMIMLMNKVLLSSRSYARVRAKENDILFHSRRREEKREKKQYRIVSHFE